MSDHDCKGCTEYRGLSRRHFLGLGGGALALAVSPGWLPRVVYADSEASDRDVLVSLFLRGGCDSLTLCLPHGDPDYYRLRPRLAVPPPDSAAAGRAIDLDGFFGLPPAMAPLVDAWDDGALAVVHATGLDAASRSHFDAMHSVEVGAGEAPEGRVSGWLGRHLAATAPSLQGAVLRAVGVGYGLQRTLAGAPDALPIENLAGFGFAGDPATEAARRETLSAMYAAVPDPLAASAAGTFRTVELLESIDFTGYQPAGGAVYPEGELGESLRATAALIRAEVGVEAVAVDVGGWDTHEQQGPLDGRMAGLMADLAAALAAFHGDLATAGCDRVMLVAMSEFGRNAFENSSAGTDHGHGGAMLVLGSGVDGGRVLADWPGLADELLYEGQDLAVTIDYRDVLAEILTKRLGNPDVGGVFDDPGYSPVDRGLIRS